MQRRVLILLTVVMVGVLAGPAAAAPPQPVDQSALTPPLNPNLAPWTCRDTGGGPICKGQVEVTYDEPFDDLTCGGQQLYIAGTLTDRATRWHTPDGRATKTNAILKAIDHVSLSPTGDGPSVTIRSTSVRHYDYPIPGDRDTRVLTETGAVYVATAPGHGLLFHDVGLIRFLPGAQHDFGDYDVVRGPHDLYESEFEILVDAICSVLLDS